MDQHLACVQSAADVYFIYHPRRSTRDLERMLTALRAMSPARAPIKEPGAQVFRMSGNAFREVLQEFQNQIAASQELLTTLLTRAELVKIVLAGPDQRVCVWVPRPGQPMDPSTFDKQHPNNSVAEHLIDTNAYLKELQAELEAGGTLHQKFFSALDRNTEADLLRKSERPEVEEVVSSLGHLKSQLERKLPERVSAGGSYHPRLNGIKDELDRLASIFLDVVLDHYPEIKGKGDTSRLQEAIEQFAVGDLRMDLQSKVWVCQPSSAYYFLFGEFALCNYRMLQIGRLSDRRWTEQIALDFARTTVRTQPLYVLAYRARARNVAKPSIDHFRSFDYDPVGASQARGRIKKQRQGFGQKSFEELCERSAAHLREHVPGWLG